VVPTICTSALADGDEAVAIPAAVPRTLAAPREQLDEAGWQQLRAACPPLRGKRAIDLTWAEQILTRPTLYRAALLNRGANLPRATQAQLPQ
jgi:hypothetical protein